MTISVSLESLLVALCTDLDIHESTRAYCLKRLRHEGITFLTVTLPKLGTAILEGLEKGFFDRSTLTCFRWKGRALAYFRELTDSVFDKWGILLEKPCAVAIYRARQLTGYFYKLALEFTSEQLESAEAKFISVDASLTHDAFCHDFTDDVRRFIETMYGSPNIVDVLRQNRPRVGPGTFAGKREVEDLADMSYYEFKRSASMHVIPDSYRDVAGFFKPFPTKSVRLSYSDSDTSDYSEVLFVPKDSRGPRTITREPLHRLKLQMAFFDYFSAHLQRVSRGRINFTDQQANQSLALFGSQDGKWATLDLKDASDRISVHVVRRISQNIGAIRYFVTRRSTHTILPSGKIIELNKLAGMGSGLTFPILALLVHSAIVVSVASEAGPLYGNHRKISDLVYVYGDDVVLPVEWVCAAKRGLERVGLLVNGSKSFTAFDHRTSGYFRESCGGDFFAGNDVGIVRLRLSNSEPMAETTTLKMGKVDNAIVQINQHAKELAVNGMLSTQRIWENTLSKVVGKLPTITNFDSSVIGHYTKVYTDVAPDAVGNYPLVKVLYPIAATVGTDAECPYIRLGEKLTSQGEVALPHLSSTVSGVPWGFLAVPRELRLVRRKVSTLSLQG